MGYSLNMEKILRETNFKWLGEKKTGKVRDIYEHDGKLILVSTDRHSSFDRIIAHIPRKGEVLNRISAFWMEKTKDIVPNHFISMPDANVTIAKKCKPLPVEAVVRGFLTGVTSTSIWTHYQAGKRDFGNFKLMDGMRKNQRLLRPVFTPSTKEDTHDRTMTPQEMVNEGIIDRMTIDTVERVALQLFERGQKIAKKQGLILVDTKYEFGMDDEEQLTLIDEIHTPDSSRWWYADSYEERFRNGDEPIYFDKEFLRLWFMEHSDPYKDELLPRAPAKLVQELSSRYLKIYHDITGESIKPLRSPVVQRIKKNLKRELAA
jgi:phosphoribosylaminoimidazole-succinocarboxamide synthase